MSSRKYISDEYTLRGCNSERYSSDGYTSKGCISRQYSLDTYTSDYVEYKHKSLQKVVYVIMEKRSTPNLVRLNQITFEQNHPGINRPPTLCIIL